MTEEDLNKELENLQKQIETGATRQNELRMQIELERVDLQERHKLIIEMEGLIKQIDNDFLRKEALQKQIETIRNKKFEDLQKRFKPITTLLDDLGDDSLKRSHMSVLISFTQMLYYMEDAIEQVKRIEQAKQGDVLHRLLTTFRDMALRYYIQFERSLLEEIQNQKTTSRQSKDVMNVIKARFSGTQESNFKKSVETAKSILRKAEIAAKAEYLRLAESYPTLLQSALDKLKDEWQRLNTIAVASRVITLNAELLDVLNVVVEAARFSVGIDVKRIAVMPGDAFSLQFYAYLKNFAVLTVPIYSVQAPWEWSIFWHELAGDKVRRLEKNTAFEIEMIRANLKLVHKKWKSKDKTKLLEFITRNNQYTEEFYKDYDVYNWMNDFSQKYLRKFFDDEKRRDWRDLGGFEHQFEQMLENLSSKERFKQYEEIKADGWCVEWFKELFEDAWSVLAIREPFIDFLQNILQRHNATDGRHPPVKIRVEVAKEILKLMKPDDKAKDPEAMTIIEAAARQILAFISLLIVHPMEGLFGLSQEYSADNPAYWDAMRPVLSDFVGSQIGKYIRNWSSKLSGDSLNETSQYIEDFKKDLEDAVDYQKSAAAAVAARQLDEIQPSYDGLLRDENGKPKDYKKLLELSFYDVDFGYPVGLTATFTFDKSSWKVSAAFVENHIRTVFDVITKPTSITDGMFSLIDIQKTETWYSISSHNFDRNKGSFQKI